MWEERLWPILTAELLGGKDKGTCWEGAVWPVRPKSPLRRERRHVVAGRVRDEGAAVYEPLNPNKTNYKNFSTIRPICTDVPNVAADTEAMQLSPRRAPAAVPAAPDDLPGWGSLSSHPDLFPYCPPHTRERLSAKLQANVSHKVTPPHMRGDHVFRPTRSSKKHRKLTRRYVVTRCERAVRRESTARSLRLLCPSELHVGKYHAVVIGVTTYADKRIESIPHAEQDVIDLQSALQELGYTVETLCGSTLPPTRENIELFVRDAIMSVPSGCTTSRYETEHDMSVAQPVVIYFIGRTRKVHIPGGDAADTMCILYCEDTPLDGDPTACLSTRSLLSRDNNGLVPCLVVDGYPLAPMQLRGEDEEPSKYEADAQAPHGRVIIEAPGLGGSLECALRNRGSTWEPHQGGLLTHYFKSLLALHESIPAQLCWNSMNAFIAQKFGKVGYPTATSASALNKRGGKMLSGLEPREACAMRQSALEARKTMKRNRKRRFYTALCEIPVVAVIKDSLPGLCAKVNNRYYRAAKCKAHKSFRVLTNEPPWPSQRHHESSRKMPRLRTRSVVGSRKGPAFPGKGRKRRLDLPGSLAASAIRSRAPGPLPGSILTSSIKPTSPRQGCLVPSPPHACLTASGTRARAPNPLSGSIVASGINDRMCSTPGSTVSGPGSPMYPVSPVTMNLSRGIRHEESFCSSQDSALELCRVRTAKSIWSESSVSSDSVAEELLIPTHPDVDTVRNLVNFDLSIAQKASIMDTVHDKGIPAFARFLSRAGPFCIILASASSDILLLLKEKIAEFDDEQWKQAAADYLGTDPADLSVQLVVGSLIKLRVETGRFYPETELFRLQESRFAMLAGLRVSGIRMEYKLNMYCTDWERRGVEKWARVDTFQGLLAVASIEEAEEVDSKLFIAAAKIQAFLRGCNVRRELLRLTTFLVTESEQRGVIYSEGLEELEKMLQELHEGCKVQMCCDEAEQRSWLEEWETEDYHYFQCRILRAVLRLDSVGSLGRTIVWYMERCGRLYLDRVRVGLSISIERDRDIALYTLTTRLETQEYRAADILNEEEYRQRLSINNQKRLPCVIPKLSKYRPKSLSKEGRRSRTSTIKRTTRRSEFMPRSSTSSPKQLN